MLVSSRTKSSFWFLIGICVLLCECDCSVCDLDGTVRVWTQQNLIVGQACAYRKKYGCPGVSLLGLMVCDPLSVTVHRWSTSTARLESRGIFRDCFLSLMPQQRPSA